jgi:hypothetical protein
VFLLTASLCRHLSQSLRLSKCSTSLQKEEETYTHTSSETGFRVQKRKRRRRRKRAPLTANAYGLWFHTLLLLLLRYILSLRIYTIYEHTFSMCAKTYSSIFFFFLFFFYKDDTGHLISTYYPHFFDFGCGRIYHLFGFWQVSSFSLEKAPHGHCATNTLSICLASQ